MVRELFCLFKEENGESANPFLNGAEMTSLPFSLYHQWLRRDHSVIHNHPEKV